jgi:hypothetical protein
MKYNRNDPSNPASLKSTKASPLVNGYGVLRSVLEEASTKTGRSLGELTVLSAQIDPYRLDTEARHRDGRWVAEQLDRLVARGRQIHWRALHYILVSTTSLAKPNGEPYKNIDEDWTWLVEVAGKAARWLGYIPFERIIDNRNAEPVICHKARIVPRSTISIGIEVTIPDIDDLEPRPVAEGFVARQAYHFVIFGEKASLEPVLLSIARAKQADLYLPQGEISDTLLFRICADAAKDGRPLILFTVSDCDPAGYQMPISIGRKLQAFKDLLFPKLKFEVVSVALTPDQVRELDLPSTPLKEGEKRADRWTEAFGIAQTEVDALLALRPDALREMVENAFAPYFDNALDDRVEAAEAKWLEQAQAAIDRQINPAVMAQVREQASTKLVELRSAIDDLKEKMNVATDLINLPDIEIPEPEIDETVARQALVHLTDSFVTASRRLIARKSYGLATTTIEQNGRRRAGRPLG